MRSPRRIFRGQVSSRPRLVRPALLAGLAAAIGVAGFGLAGLSSELFGRAPAAPERMSAEPGAVAIIDGETLRLDGHVVRLRGIDAPTRGDLCRGGVDCGGAATSALAGLVRQRRVECRLTGHDAAGRPFASCEAGGADLSRAVVASGWARARPGAPELADLELRARRQGSGLWAGTAAN